MIRIVLRPVTWLLVLALVACGASARTKTLRVNLIALNAARDTTLVVSKQREKQIIADAKAKEEGRAQLDKWRAKIDEVMAKIDVGYDAIFAAALLDDAKSTSEAIAAVATALKLIKAVLQLTKPQTLPEKPQPSATETPRS